VCVFFKKFILKVDLIFVKQKDLNETLLQTVVNLKNDFEKAFVRGKIDKFQNELLQKKISDDIERIRSA
jgi:hypothetical protein